MILSKMFYGIECDRCGQLHEDDEHSYWHDSETAIEYAIESDWHEEKGKHYCTNCHEVNDETDLITVFEEYPKRLKTLNTFIDKITQAKSREVLEYDKEFVVTCRLYNTPKLDDLEELFIENLLAEKFISLEYDKKNHRNSICSIKFIK